MRKQRKNSGGYALAYVLVIILVLCAIAMTICTVALRNYQTQARSVAHTRLLYQAEGEIEKLASVAEQLSELGVTGEYNSKDKAAGAYQSSLQGKWSGTGCTPLSFSGSSGSMKVSASYENESVKIDTELQMHLTYADIPHYLNGAVSYTYQITSAKLMGYGAYTITRLTASGEGET